MSSTLITRFLEFLTQLKVYHWQTTIYSRHIASDELYQQSQPLIDTFIETFQGKNFDRIKLTKENNKLELFNLDEEDVISFLSEFKAFLVDEIPKLLDKEMKNYDLLNIRDELLGLVNKTLYLFSLQ